MTERQNPHLFWIVYCIISCKDVAFSSLDFIRARNKFLESFLYKTDCRQNGKTKIENGLNYSAYEALFWTNLHLVRSGPNIGKQGITCRRVE